MIIGSFIAFMFLVLLLIGYNIRKEVEFQRRLRKMEEEEKGEHRQSH